MKKLAVSTVVGVTVWLLAACTVSESGVEIIPSIAQAIPGLINLTGVLLLGVILRALGVDLGQNFGIGF